MRRLWAVGSAMAALAALASWVVVDSMRPDDRAASADARLDPVTDRNPGEAGSLVAASMPAPVSRIGEADEPSTDGSMMSDRAASHVTAVDAPQGDAVTAHAIAGGASPKGHAPADSREGAVEGEKDAGLGSDDTRRYCEGSTHAVSPNGYVFAETQALFDLMPQHAIWYVRSPDSRTRSSGDEIMDAIVRNVCAMTPWPDDYPAPRYTLVLLNRRADVTLHVGDGWIGDGAWLAPIAPEDLARIQLLLDKRRANNSGPNMSLAEFGAYVEQQRARYP